MDFPETGEVPGSSTREVLDLSQRNKSTVTGTGESSGGSLRTEPNADAINRTRVLSGVSPGQSGFQGYSGSSEGPATVSAPPISPQPLSTTRGYPYKSFSPVQQYEYMNFDHTVTKSTKVKPPPAHHQPMTSARNIKHPPQSPKLKYNIFVGQASTILGNEIPREIDNPTNEVRQWQQVNISESVNNRDNVDTAGKESSQSRLFVKPDIPGQDQDEPMPSISRRSSFMKKEKVFSSDQIYTSDSTSGEGHDEPIPSISRQDHVKKKVSFDIPDSKVTSVKKQYRPPSPAAGALQKIEHTATRQGCNASINERKEAERIRRIANMTKLLKMFCLSPTSPSSDKLRMQSSPTGETIISVPPLICPEESQKSEFSQKPVESTFTTPTKKRIVNIFPDCYGSTAGIKRVIYTENTATSSKFQKQYVDSTVSSPTDAALNEIAPQIQTYQTQSGKTGNFKEDTESNSTKTKEARKHGYALVSSSHQSHKKRSIEPEQYADFKKLKYTKKTIQKHSKDASTKTQDVSWKEYSENVTSKLDKKRLRPTSEDTDNKSTKKLKKHTNFCEPQEKSLGSGVLQEETSSKEDNAFIFREPKLPISASPEAGKSDVRKKKKKHSSKRHSNYLVKPHVPEEKYVTQTGYITEVQYSGDNTNNEINAVSTSEPISATETDSNEVGNTDSWHESSESSAPTSPFPATEDLDVSGYSSPVSDQDQRPASTDSNPYFQRSGGTLTNKVDGDLVRAMIMHFVEASPGKPIAPLVGAFERNGISPDSQDSGTVSPENIVQHTESTETNIDETSCELHQQNTEEATVCQNNRSTLNEDALAEKTTASLNQIEDETECQNSTNMETELSENQETVAETTVVNNFLLTIKTEEETDYTVPTAMETNSLENQEVVVKTENVDTTGSESCLPINFPFTIKTEDEAMCQNTASPAPNLPSPRENSTTTNNCSSDIEVVKNAFSSKNVPVPIKIEDETGQGSMEMESNPSVEEEAVVEDDSTNCEDSAALNIPEEPGAFLEHRESKEGENNDDEEEQMETMATPLELQENDSNEDDISSTVNCENTATSMHCPGTLKELALTRAIYYLKLDKSKLTEQEQANISQTVRNPPNSNSDVSVVSTADTPTNAASATGNRQSSGYVTFIIDIDYVMNICNRLLCDLNRPSLTGECQDTQTSTHIENLTTPLEQQEESTNPTAYARETLYNLGGQITVFQPSQYITTIIEVLKIFDTYETNGHFPENAGSIKTTYRKNVARNCLHPTMDNFNGTGTQVLQLSQQPQATADNPVNVSPRRQQCELGFPPTTSTSSNSTAASVLHGSHQSTEFRQSVIQENPTFPTANAFLSSTESTQQHIGEGQNTFHSTTRDMVNTQGVLPNYLQSTQHSQCTVFTQPEAPQFLPSASEGAAPARKKRGRPPKNKGILPNYRVSGGLPHGLNLGASRPNMTDQVDILPNSYPFTPYNSSVIPRIHSSLPNSTNAGNFLQNSFQSQWPTYQGMPHFLPGVPSGSDNVFLNSYQPMYQNIPPRYYSSMEPPRTPHFIPPPVPQQQPSAERVDYGYQCSASVLEEYERAKKRNDSKYFEDMKKSSMYDASVIQEYENGKEIIRIIREMMKELNATKAAQGEIRHPPIYPQPSQNTAFRSASEWENSWPVEQILPLNLSINKSNEGR